MNGAGRTVPVRVSKMIRYLERQGFQRAGDKGWKYVHPEHLSWGHFNFGCDGGEEVNRNVAQRIARSLGYRSTEAFVSEVRKS